VTAVLRVDDELGAGALDRVRGVEVRVAGDHLPGLAGPVGRGQEQQVPVGVVPAVPQVEHDVLAERPDVVRLGRRRDQRRHLRDGVRREAGADGDTAGRGQRDGGVGHAASLGRVWWVIAVARTHQTRLGPRPARAQGRTVICTAGESSASDGQMCRTFAHWGRFA
jgi:hypothetical protein